MSNKIYKGFYNIVKNIASKEATIYIYGVIGGFDWDTYSYINTSNKFVQEFNELEKTADIIHVHINSPGGSIYDGMPIYNVLNNSKKTIYTYVDGLAASMASLIALAGDKVFGYRNSMFMVHNASTFAFGNSKDLLEESQSLETYDKSLGTIIEDKLNLTGDQVKEKYLNYKDNYFTGDESLAEGFFDEILTGEKSSLPEDFKAMNHQDVLKHYSNMNFDVTEPNTTNTTKTNNMSKEITAPSIQNVLGYDAPFQSNENGVFLQEAEIATLETSLVTANQTSAEATIQKDAAIAQKEVVTGKLTEANTAIDAALTSAEISFTPENSLSEKVNLLEAQRKEFAVKSAGGKTVVVNEGSDEDPAGPTEQKVYAHNFEANKILNN